MMPALRLENVMCLRLLSSMYSILILRLPDRFSPARGGSSSESSSSSRRFEFDSNCSDGVELEPPSLRKTLISGALGSKEGEAVDWWRSWVVSLFPNALPELSGWWEEAKPPRDC